MADTEKKRRVLTPEMIEKLRLGKLKKKEERLRQLKEQEEESKQEEQEEPVEEVVEEPVEVVEVPTKAVISMEDIKDKYPSLRDMVLDLFPDVQARLKEEKENGKEVYSK